MSLEIAPAAIEAGVKLLVAVGAPYTSSVAVAGPPLGALPEVTVPVLLSFAPAVAPVTVTE